jgi:hypothetical protein
MLSILYFGIGGALVVGVFFGSGRLHPETCVALAIMLGVLAFPSSHLVAYLSYTLVSVIWPDRTPWVVLLAGYFQWFYIFPWIFQKLRTFF